MADNDFVPWATGTGANALSPANFKALSGRANGFTSGIAASIQANAIWRQTSSVAAMIGQFIADFSGASATDDGNIPVLENNFLAALRNRIAAYVDPLTPRGAKTAKSFTAGIGLNDFTGGSNATSGPFTVAQTLTVSGATYLQVTGTVGFRTSTTGTDCRARLRITPSNGTATTYDYLGCRPGGGYQIPVTVTARARGLDTTKTALIELIVDRTETSGTVNVYDPTITVDHDGNA